MMLKMERARIEETKKREKEEEAMASRSKRLGEGDVQFDQERLSRALKEERKRKADEGDEGKYGDKRRKYNSAMDVDVTEEDLGMLLYRQFCPLADQNLQRLIV
jgi:pre-mRNA-processing factor SLU7